MQISIHLIFPGTCEEAFRFYQDILGGTIVTMLKYRDSPMATIVSEEMLDKIVHVNLSIDKQMIAGADVSEAQYQKPEGYYVLLNIEEPERAKKIFEEMTVNGQVIMPVQETFWAKYFGVFIDKYGTRWEINCSADGVSQ